TRRSGWECGVTVFVNNILTRLHWRKLGRIFITYGKGK
ncbi:hypothetical protein Goari_026213, partial [Gossypium aridum]|nr:hypothetical protein [Gossypium aridum]